MSGAINQSASIAAEDEQPPPFTSGSFIDPVMEKVSSATRQRELYFQSQAIESQGARSTHNRISLQRSHMLDDPFASNSYYPVDAVDYPVTSPILGGEDHESLAISTTDSHSPEGNIGRELRM